MSRRDRRRAMQDAKNFTPKKSNSMNKWVIVALAVIAVVFFVGTTIIQRGA